MQSLDPKLVLKRGYAWVTGPDGATIVDRATAAKETVLTLKFRDGDLTVVPPNGKPAPRPRKPNLEQGTPSAQEDLFG